MAIVIVQAWCDEGRYVEYFIEMNALKKFYVGKVDKI